MKLLPVLINRLDDVHRLVDTIYTKGNMYTYDFETLGTQPRKLRVAGIGLAYGFERGQGSYIMTAHDNYKVLDWEKVLEVLRPLFEDDSMTMVAHNQLFDATILDTYGVKLHMNTYDTMVMNWLLSTDVPHGLKEIVHRLYGYRMAELTDFATKRQVDWHPAEKIYSLDRVDIDKMTSYGVDDVLWTYRLALEEIEAIREDRNLSVIYDQLYRKYLNVLVSMQSVGIQMDSDKIRVMEKEITPLITRMQAELLEMREGQDFDPSLMVSTNAMIKSIGLQSFLEGPASVREDCINRDRKLIPELQQKWLKRDKIRPLLYANPHLSHKIYNLNSNDNINTILFDEFDLDPVGDKTKMDLYKTDAKSLLKIQNQDDSGYVKKFLLYKRYHKLNSQYLAGLLPWLDDDGRLRSSFNATLKTGRLSSRRPNLQNIIHDKKFPVRSAFVCRPGHKLIVLDYSQMELRILAHFSKDETMIHGFMQDFDPHSNTAKRVFNLDCEVNEVATLYPNYRKIAKTLNFATVYQVGAESLIEQIAEATDGEVVPTLRESQGFIDRVFEEFPGIRSYIAAAKKMAQAKGEVYTLMYRPRHLPDAQQRDNMRAYYGALRRAVNSPIQGTAADAIGIAMCNIYDELTEMNLWRNGVWMCLQVHDELIFEVRDDLVETIQPILETEMIHAMALDVPLKADGKVANNWYEGK